MIRYSTQESLRVEEIGPFFADWKMPPSREKQKALLEGSDVVVTARGEDGKLVGILMAITDGALHALITILKVLPEIRHQGVGTELLAKALSELGRLYDITLISDAGIAPFYEPHGFHPGFSMNLRDVGATR